MEQDKSVGFIRMTPKDFFLHLAAIITLYISAGSLIGLLFQIINISFPDRLMPYFDPYSAGIRFAIASLIVIFPVYILISWYLTRDLRRQPEKRDLPLRKWLVYLTLFAAGALIVGDLIALLNSFLSGEITTRFSLKVLVILVVAGYVFGYYLYDLRRGGMPDSRVQKLLATIAAIFVLGSIVGGFAIMGSPAKQRVLRFDQQKVNDLQNIQYQVVDFYRRTSRLPASLEEVANPTLGVVVPTDPQTSKPYTYRSTTTTAFELCAEFNLPSPQGSQGIGTKEIPESISSPVVIDDPRSTYWQHGTGETCFIRTVSPDILNNAKPR